VLLGARAAGGEAEEGQFLDVGAGWGEGGGGGTEGGGCGAAGGGLLVEVRGGLGLGCGEGRGGGGAAFVDTLERRPEIHGLLAVEEEDHGRAGEHEGAEVRDPAPAHGLGHPACHQGGEVVGAEEHEGVEAHVEAAVVGEEDIRDGDLGQGLDGRRQDAEDDAVRVPLARRVRVRLPHHGADGQDAGQDVDAAAPVAERDGLPEETSPAEEEEHQARAEIQLRDGDAGVLRDLREDRVLQRGGDADACGVDVGHADGEELALPRPVQGVFGVGGGLGVQDDLAIAAELIFVDQMDGAGDNICVGGRCHGWLLCC